MAEYIDTNLLIEKMSRLRGCSCSYSDGIIDEIEDIMSDIPTANVVEREKIDKAIEEIKGQFYVLLKDETTVEELWWNNALEKTLEILKRNIEE